MLISTKIQPPALREALVERPRLLRLLDRAAAGKLAIVSSPAGFGKSTLLSQWAARATGRRGAVAWLSVDALDNELARFLKYVTAALHRVDPAIAANAESLIDSSPITPIDSILTTLVNDLAKRTDPIHLVIDDAHFLVSSEIATFLNALVAYAPPSLHVVLATRGELPIELGSMKIKGYVVDLGDADLRFSLEETEEYMKSVSRLDLSVSAVVQLHHKTEGWPAGLQLAALALAHEEAPEAFIAEFSGSQRDVATFLAHEVLARQPAEIQEFLLRTSVLGRFSLPLLQAVSPDQDCAAALAHVERSNLFLIALDSTGQWYRYHQLLSEFLRNLVRSWPEDRRAALHRAAADWLVRNGHVSDAVGHALATGDSVFAASLVETCAMPLVMQGHIPRVTEWLNQLPAALIAVRPRLLLTRVWAEFHTSRPRQAARILKQAKDLINRQAADGLLDRATIRSLKAELQTLTAGVVSASDRSRTATSIARRWLADFPEDEFFARGALSNICAFSHYSLGELDEARLRALKGRDYHEAMGSVFGVVYSDLILALIEIAAGNLFRAKDLLDRACRLARDRLGAGSYTEAMTAIFEVELRYEWNDLAGAERLLHQHRQIIEECGLVVHEMACKLHLARLAAASGREDDAIVFLERAERLGAEKRYRRLTASALNDRVRLLLARGDIRAARLALRSRGIDPSNTGDARDIHPLHEYAHIGAARVMIAEGQCARAIAVLDRIAKRMRADGRFRGYMQVRALTAIAANKAGDVLLALAAAVDVVTLALPQNAVRSLLDEGPAMQNVLELAQSKLPAWTSTSETADFVRRLLNEFGSEGAAPGRIPSRSGPARKRALSTKEAEVAGLLMRAYSNRQLAQSLSMAPDTVKWHLKNIFGKLGVSNRTEAVLRLKELGLAAGPEQRLMP